MTAWPGTLPVKPEINGYMEDPGNQKVSSNVDAGPPKQRRRFSTSVAKLTLSFQMTSAQVDTFETFFDSTLQGGALTYDWTHPRTGNAITVQIDGNYSVIPVGGTTYMVKFKVIILS